MGVGSVTYPVGVYSGLTSTGLGHVIGTVMRTGITGQGGTPDIAGSTSSGGLL